ncbi:ccch zinc finger and rrm domain-containing protein [Seiridium cupressi]
MLFAEADAPHLRAWIIKRLENTSDADADVLADYVIALLRHDGDVDTIRSLFEEEIPDFLREDSAAFTDDVFQAVKYKSYLPGAPPAPPITRQTQAPASLTSQIPLGPAALQQNSFLPYDVQHTPYAETPSAFPSHNLRNGSKKRSYRDLDAPDTQSMNWDLYGGGPGYPQPYKQAKRGGGLNPRGGRFDDPYGSRGRGGHGSFNSGPPPSGPSAPYPGAGYGPPAPGYNPQQPFATSQPTIDANTIMENIRQLQELGAQMGIQLPQTGSLPKPVYSGQTMSAPSGQRRPPCRDYETKGYCSRGNRCQFEHGNSSGYVPSFQAPPGDEYDPNNAAMGMPGHPGQPVNPIDMMTMQMPASNRREFKKSKRKGGRTAISAEGPNSDKTNTKIVIENIPEESFTEDAIRGFFTEFGSIKEIELRPTRGSPKRVAVVEFDSWAAANTAWRSPKVVFDNRFVKVYWYKDESQLGSDIKHENGASNGPPNVDGASMDPEFDIEEFQRKQEEAQKTHLEKQQKREELERQRQDLEDKRKELAQRQQEVKRQLQAKLAANGVKEDSISPILTTATVDGEKPLQADALRARLAALEEEATSLGLDPDAADDSGSWAPRGRGRGRRPYRGRGSYPPRVWRGGSGYRGRGGGVTQDVHAAYAAYSLDNRPKIVVITGADFTDPVKDEALKQYLFGIGEFTDVYTEPSATHVTFKDRKTAEQFMFGVSAQKSIPGVDDKVELAWATSAPKAVGADSDFPTAGGLEEEQSIKPDQDVEENNGFGRINSGKQDDMDYEGGDWGIS